MQSQHTNHRIEMFGNLVEELSYWNDQCNHEDGDSLDYCETKFEETLSAVKEFREELLKELYEYIRDCNEDDIPIDISYYRILKQLEQSTFEIVYE